MIDGIADHRNRGYASLPRDAKSKERRRLHLDREYALTGPLFQLHFGFTVRGIRRPHLTRADGPSGRDQLPLEKEGYRRLARDLTRWWQVVVGSSLVTNRTRRHDEAWERQIGRHAAGGCQSDDDFRPSSLELLGNQHRVRSPDRPRHDSARNPFEIHREHRGMKARPRPERLGRALSHQPVRQISIELKDTDRGNVSVRARPTPAHLAA